MKGKVEDIPQEYYCTAVLQPGIKITCWHCGNVICEIVEPIVWGGKERINRSTALGNYTIGEHVATNGDNSSQCCCSKCDRPWYAFNKTLDSPTFHTEHGWWPPL